MANKCFGISYTDAFKTILFERLVEAIPIALLLIYVLYSFPFLEIKFLPQINSLTLKSIHLLILAFLIAGIGIWFLRAKFDAIFKNVQQSWKQFKKSFLPVLLLSCGVWGFDIIRLELVALSLNEIVTVSTLSFLLGLLSLTPGGPGIIEGDLISLLLYFGSPLASAGSFVFLERFISYGISSVIGLISLSYYGRYNIWRKAKKVKLD